MRTCASVWQAYFRQKAAPPRGDKASVWAILLDTIGSRTNDGSVRMIARLLLGLGVSIALVSSAIAELAMTGAPVTMRVGPTGNAGIVQRIPQRAEISLEKCLRDWCRASWRGRFGYTLRKRSCSGLLRLPCLAMRCRRRSSARPQPMPRPRHGDGQGPTSVLTAVSGPAPGSADRSRTRAALPMSAARSYMGV
jgi:hypothetical protein